MGAPLVSGAAVTAKVVSHGAARKCASTKCAGASTTQRPGPPANYTEIEIVGITS